MGETARMLFHLNLSPRGLGEVQKGRRSMINRAVVMSEAVLASRLKNYPNLTQHHLVICISEPGRPHLLETGGNVLCLSFHDVDPQQFEDCDAAALKRYTIFSPAVADTLVRFLKERSAATDRAQILVVQCQAGVARSGAVGKFALELFRLNRDEFAADNPNILPNEHVLRLLRQTAGLPEHPVSVKS